MKLLIIILFLFLSIDLFPQTDWKKWDKAETDYKLSENINERNYNFKSENAGEFILKSFFNTYRFLISDVDGDNCPFRPSCSAFFLDAAVETNILQGSLMFFDRFTRDLNVFKKGKYPLVRSKHYYDPAELYTLSDNRIKYIPPSEILITE